MRRLLQAISWVALAGIVIPSILFYMGTIELQRMQWLLLVATILWFIVTPLWMDRADPNARQPLQAD